MVDIDDFIDLYSEGLSLEEISNRLSATVDEIKEVLLDFKELSIVPSKGRSKNYTTEFTGVVIDRILRGIPHDEVAKENGMSKNTLQSVLKKSGYNYSFREAQQEFIIIEWDKMCTCPKCKSAEHVRKIVDGSCDLKHGFERSFCTECNVDWFGDLEKDGFEEVIEKGKVKKKQKFKEVMKMSVFENLD